MSTPVKVQYRAAGPSGNRLGRCLAPALLALVLCCGPSAMADDLAESRHHGRIIDALKLTDTQKREVQKILDETHPEIERLRQQRKDVRTKMRERLKSVLTPEQQQQFERLEQERRLEHRQRRQRPD